MISSAINTLWPPQASFPCEMKGVVDWRYFHQHFNTILAKSIFLWYENIIFTNNLSKNRPNFLAKIITLGVISTKGLGSCIVYLGGWGRNRKTYGYFSSVDVAHIDSDKNISFTSMNFDVVATISLLVKSLHWKLQHVFSILLSIFIKNEIFFLNFKQVLIIFFIQKAFMCVSLRFFLIVKQALIIFLLKGFLMPVSLWLL